jgi:Relaxase/Mobilisation nuclease domain
MPIIINGGSNRAGGWWAKHLENGEKNERVALVEITGLTAESVPEAFREMEGIAAGTRCRNYFYQANINPREDERLTPAQWREAIDTLEKNLGLTGQPRFVIEHEKKGRVHQHVVWSRIDADRMVAISDSLTAPIHERTSRELEIKFDLERGRSILTPDRDFERPERRPPKSETFRTAESGIDPETVKAQLRALWQHADNGQSFKAALESEGYALARGDRRDFVVIDRAGDDHSLARRLGVKAADVRERMADIDRAALPSVAEAKTQQRDRQIEHDRQKAQQPEQSPEPSAGERSRYDPLRETEHQVRREQFNGKYDELRAAEPAKIEREFASNASSAAEPVAPIYERDLYNEDWEAKLTEAAIIIAGTEAEQTPPEARQRPDPNAGKETRAGIGQPADGPEKQPHAGDEREESIEAWAERSAGNRTAHEMADAAEDTLDAASRTTGKMLGGLAKAVEQVLGGLLSFLGAGDTKLSPLQAELAEHAADERAKTRDINAAEQEAQALRDWIVFQQDRQQQQEDLERETGQREREGDRERQRERDRY